MELIIHTTHLTILLKQIGLYIISNGKANVQSLLIIIEVE